MLDLKEYYLGYYENDGTPKEIANNSEYYATTESIPSTQYPNPFVTLQNKITNA